MNKYNLQSVTIKNSLTNYEKQSKPNTWVVQQMQAVAHILDMQTGHRSWSAQRKRSGYCWWLWQQQRWQWRNRSCCFHNPAQADCSPAVQL